MTPASLALLRLYITHQRLEIDSQNQAPVKILITGIIISLTRDVTILCDPYTTPTAKSKHYPSWQIL